MSRPEFLQMRINLFLSSPVFLNLYYLDHLGMEFVLDINAKFKLRHDDTAQILQFSN
jgi:hypothetical protein